jgi:hypothetical protein
MADFQLAALVQRIREEERRRQLISVADRLPEDGVQVLTLRPSREGDWGEEDRYGFDMRDDGVWVAHNNNYEEFMAVGGHNAVPGEACVGPDEQAPYTHWWPLPPSRRCNTEPEMTKDRNADELEMTDLHLLDLRRIPTNLPSNEYKCGDEFKPFHPAASHIPAEYRDGWNRCWLAARSRSTAINNIAKARHVRLLAAAGKSVEETAAETGVSEAMVSDIRRGRSWRELSASPFAGLA